MVATYEIEIPDDRTLDLIRYARRCGCMLQVPGLLGCPDVKWALEQAVLSVIDTLEKV